MASCDFSKSKKYQWSGHREAVSRLKENYHSVLDALQHARMLKESMKIDSTDVALATGLLTMIMEDQ